MNTALQYDISFENLSGIRVSPMLSYEPEMAQLGIQRMFSSVEFSDYTIQFDSRESRDLFRQRAKMVGFEGHVYGIQQGREVGHFNLSFPHSATCEFDSDDNFFYVLLGD